MLIFILTPFDTWDFYYFGLNFSLLLLIKIFFIKKHVTLFFRNNFATWIYFCVYLVFHWNDIVEKILPKVGAWKRDKKRIWSYRELYIEGGSKPSAHYISRQFDFFNFLVDVFRCIFQNMKQEQWSKLWLVIDHDQPDFQFDWTIFSWNL